jgi:host factor-I protein
MPHTPEPKVSAAPPNIQDVFLNYARRDRVAVTIQLMSGETLEGRIKNFDRFAVIVEVAGADQMLFKHAIASIRTPRPVGNYFTHS